MAKKKQSPRRERRRTKPTLPASASSSDGPAYFHGGVPDLEPGDILRSAADLGFNVAYHTEAADEVYDPGYVYLTTKVEIATSYAARCVMPVVNEVPGDVYRVQPLGPLESDPDYDGMPGIYMRAPRARVLEVVRTEVALSDREQIQLEAPWLGWGSLDQPMYDADGFMIPSEEMKANGITAEHTRIYGPWLPAHRIDPRGFYYPTPAAQRRGLEAIGAELLDQVPGIDAPDHLVTVEGDYASIGREISYTCVCGARRGPNSPPPHDHQLGEHLLELMRAGLDNNERQMLPEMLARAAALRSPDRWRWYTPRPVVIVPEERC